MKHTGRVALLVAVCLLSGACGTTARLGAGGAAGSGAGLGSNGTGGPGAVQTSASGTGSSESIPGSGVGAPGASGPSTDAASAGSVGTAAGRGPGGGPGSAVAAYGPGGTGTVSGVQTNSGTPTASAPGVTPAAIYVGFSYATESSSTAANQAIGGAGITQGNTQGEAQAMINYMNSQGGILGRKVIPVWYAENALSTETVDQLYQGECQAFEQDKHVFAIFDGGNAIPEECAQKAGAVAIYDDLSISSAHTFAQFPSYFEVGGMMDLNRIVLNETMAMGAQDYFSPWDSNLSRPGTSRAKVGVITYDSPDFRYAVGQVMLPELARLGYSPASPDVVYVTEPQTNADVSSMSAAVSNAVLRFRTDGVDHVFIVDATGLITLEFLNAAHSQHYYPRYAFNTQNGPQALATPGDIPTDELNGALGIGWSPMLDLPSSADADNGPYSNEARRACLAIMRAGGFTYPDTNSESAALGICVSFQFLKDAITAGGAVIDQSSFISGADKLGWWPGAGDTFGQFFDASQHDGAAYYRYYDWNGSCGCMQYVGGSRTAIGEGEQ